MTTLITPMEWDYFSELRLPTGLLFIPRWGACRTMVEWYRKRTPDLSTRALWQSYQYSNLEASRRRGLREWRIWPRKVILSILASDILHTLKSYDIGPPALLSFRRKVCCGFVWPLKSTASAGFKPANLGSSASTLSCYTTEATRPTLVHTLIIINYNLESCHMFLH
jgi:hypothetical protein